MLKRLDTQSHMQQNNLGPNDKQPLGVCSVFDSNEKYECIRNIIMSY